jgi:hypothetical protein
VSASSCWSIPGIRIIDLDTTELPSNDREIFEAVVERMSTDPSVLETKVPGAAASVATTSADAGALSSVALATDVAVSEQPTLGQGGDVGGLVLSNMSEAAEGVLGETVAGMESIAIAPPLQSVGAVEEVVEAAESLSVQPAVAVEVVAPATSQPTMAPQERVAPEGAMRAASSEIQETREGSGVALPWGTRGDGNCVLDLAHIPWAAAFEVSDDAEEDEESAARHTFEHGLTWARRAFDEVILPAMSVRLPCTTAYVFLHSSAIHDLHFPCLK